MTGWAALDDVVVPIVGAPLAGGPSTPALAAAVSEAGAIGFLAAGYKTAAAVEAEVHELRALTARPIGLNLFYPIREAVDETALEAYAERLRSETDRYGVELGEPLWSDDDWTAKLEVAARERPEVVSFTFGCPEREVVEPLRGCGCRIWCTVTSIAEAERATATRVRSRGARMSCPFCGQEVESVRLRRHSRRHRSEAVGAGRRGSYHVRARSRRQTSAIILDQGRPGGWCRCTSCPRFG